MKIFQGFEYEVFKDSYNIGEDSKGVTVMIHKYKGDETDVVIPEKIEGLPVTKLIFTFDKLEKIKKVTLPKHLTGIFDGSFRGCKKLKTIHFPPNLTRVSNEAFKDCVNLEKITLEKGFPQCERLEFDTNIFDNCPKLYDENDFLLIDNILVSYCGEKTDLILPDSVTSVVNSVFSNNKTIKSVTIPDSVSVIANSVFENCTSLECIKLPENLLVIDKNTFLDCKKLKNIIWNTKVRQILDGAFNKCISLTEISFPEEINQIGKSFIGCKNLKKITIPPSVEFIESKAFDKCHSLEQVVILPRTKDDNVLTIKTGGFPYSKKMREIFLEKGTEVPVIVVLSFSKGDSEKYYTDLLSLWDNISEESKDIFRTEWKKKISSKVKQGKNRLRNLVFLQSTAREMAIYFNEGFHLELPELDEYLEISIGNENTAETALLLDYKNKTYSKEFLDEIENHENMLTLGFELPTLKELRKKWKVEVGENEITIIGYKGKSTSEIIPESIDTGLPIRYLRSPKPFLAPLENNCFYPLEQLILPENFVKTLNACFNLSTLKEISLPKSMTVIPTNMFFCAKDLKKITLHEGIVEIENNAFEYCTSLEKIELPESLVIIGESAFQNCRCLSKLHCPKNLNKVSENAFKSCSNLTQIILANKEMLTVFDPTAFENCKNLVFVGTDGGENLLPSFQK